MIKKAQNTRGEITIPSDFDDLYGYDGKACKSTNIDRCTIRFGSPVDQAAANLFEQLKDYIKDRDEKKDLSKCKRSIFDILSEYFNKIMELGNPIVWGRVKAEPHKIRKQITMR